MRGLIEMAIEREAERLDAIFEADEAFAPPLFVSRHFRPRIHPQTRKFAPRGNSRQHFSPRTTAISHYSL